jgi:hypothetical protein
MATNHDPATNPPPGSHGALPADHPVEALLRDHDLVRRLAGAWLTDESPAARNQAAKQLLQALEMHARLEEAVFYSAVRGVDAALISHFEDVHHHTDDMVEIARRMEENDPRRDAVLRQLIEAALYHISEEEVQLFPKLEQAHLDMTPIGLQMQAFEANLVHMAAQASEQPARR